MKKFLVALCVTFMLSGCGGPTLPTGVKVGNPYVVDGQTYNPEYDPHYDKIGMASWYGPGFHGGKTANGERFDQEDLTAASPTLPMPSMVRVTNLANGESAVIRINDRGPFKHGRIIDLSHASAQALGITGLQKVRVQYLKEETEAYWAKQHLQTDEIQFAQNDPYAPSESAPVRAAAPVTSVVSEDLGGTHVKPEDLKFRPMPAQFRVVDDAQADDSASEPAAYAPKPKAEKTAPAVKQEEDASEEGTDAADAPEEAATPPAHTQTKVVRLVHNADDDSTDAPIAVTHASATAGGKWFIQAGSFVSEENAHRLASRLEGLAAVEVKPVDAGGQTWHRVRLGPFSDRSAAEQALGKVVLQGATGAQIVGD